MNFLPLVFIFILIFGTFSFHFLGTSFLEETEKKGYQGRIRATRFAYNRSEHVYYNAQKERSKPGNPKPKKTTTKDTKKKPYFRLRRLGSEHGAINLAPLTLYNDPVLYQIALSYLEKVYSHAFFYDDPNLAKTLLDFILSEQKKSWKRTQSFHELKDLKPQGPLEKCYAMFIRGTNSFDPEKQQGYMPLDLCICFNGSDNPPINLHFANTALLTILFGKKGRQLIERTEWPNSVPREGHRYQKYALTKAELKSLLKSDLNDDLLKLLDDTYHRGSKSPRRSVDPETNITAQINAG